MTTHRLPEFKFWMHSGRAFLLGFGATFFAVFDVPVFWPILLLYWCAGTSVGQCSDSSGGNKVPGGSGRGNGQDLFDGPPSNPSTHTGLCSSLSQ